MFNLVLSHFIGDFILQSHYIAERKLKEFIICVLHVLFYVIPFYFLVSASFKFLFVVAATHLLIDYLRFAEYISWIKNVLLNPKIWVLDKAELQRYNLQNCKFGYPKDVPEHIAFWLMIVVDQILHLSTNLFIYCLFSVKS